jgi:membrane protein required for beta-lactamase induction
MSLKSYVRYLPIPALVLALIGILLMVVHPNEQGVVFGGLLFTVAVVLFSIGEISRKPRQPLSNVRTSS